MKLTPPKNENYAATIIAVRAVLDLPKSDRIVGVPVFGFQAITSKADTKVGDLRVLFTAETQLSTEYAAANNLHRHSDRNADPSIVGYLEDTRRVKALRLRGNVSNALLMPLSSLAFTGADVTQLKAGDTFDSLNGVEICRKYQLRMPGQRGQVAKQTPKSLQRVDELKFPKHFDTANYFRNAEQIRSSDYVYVTQKLHGTSIRIGHVQVKRKLSWLDKVARKLGVKVQETEYDYVYGSRNVVKDPENPFLKGDFYGTDIYSEVGKRLRGLIPKGYVIYGELVGWAGETPIQPGFTYGVSVGTTELYVYRIVTINESGLSRDLPWSQVKSFCLEAGLNHVPQVWEGVGFTEEFAHVFLDSKLAERWPAALPVDVVDEGVCVRVDGQIPLVLKAKSPMFLEIESKHLDKNVADMESAA